MLTGDRRSATGTRGAAILAPLLVGAIAAIALAFLPLTILTAIIYSHEVKKSC